MQTIYCLEDDPNIRELIIYALKSEGYKAMGFKDSKDFYSQIKLELPHLILLDIMLPGEDGISILKGLRNNSRTSQIPIIMLTAKAAEYDKVLGLDSGADDYITKPFGIMELLSRVRALLRRANPSLSKPNVLTLGSIRLDMDRRSVHVGNESVALTFKEFELLCYLMENQGTVLSREKIMDTVWGFDYAGESRTVDMHIKTLRHKLGEAGKKIITVRGVGYKIEG